MVESSVTGSVTKQEIAFYWKQRRMVEEDHLYAAIKAAARLRARNLSVGDYLKFKDSLEEEEEGESKENENSTKLCGKMYDKEIRVGINDWWTKSKYAYLNQPAIKSDGNLRRRSCAYLPQFFSYKSTSLLTPTYGYSTQPNFQVM